MAKKRARNTNKKRTFPWWIWALGLCVIWLAAATFVQKSPTQLLTDLGRSLLGKGSLYQSPEQQSETVLQFEDSLATLQKEISELKNRSPYRKAIVNTSANSLNLRAASNLNSDVVIKIPDSSVVEVLYFDEEVLVLDGEAGKWCKVKYADKEGWVWGNYVELLD